MTKAKEERDEMSDDTFSAETRAEWIRDKVERVKGMVEQDGWFEGLKGAIKYSMEAVDLLDDLTGQERYEVFEACIMGYIDDPAFNAPGPDAFTKPAMKWACSNLVLPLVTWGICEATKGNISVNK